jgi:hypothetical protein
MNGNVGFPVAAAVDVQVEDGASFDWLTGTDDGLSWLES